MSKPVVVSIPHHLGKEEAQRRLQGGVGRLRTQFGDKLGTIEDTWTGSHADFKVSVLGQGVTGSLDVMDDQVRVEVQLPWLLAMVAEKAKALIQKQGTLMLEKK
ncbi:MAG TPA: polyhydroxyalkanoic acid system family protein [Beijerinckiaceae bacterium]|jgi:putative polyhydroxyalkanoate system protein